MDELLEKYYRVYAEINLDCIRDNILAMKQNVGEDTAMAAVLKTDGYGHGAVPIALALKDMVQAFAVATIDEGINLRKHGLDNEIFILGFLPEGRIEDAITYEIYPAVFEYSMAEKISRKAVQIGKQAKIQIKVDTGMGRIGFPVSEESVETVARISKLPNLVIDGIFTHFASSDSTDKTMANGQYEKFIWFTESLKKRGVTIRVRHCDNSAGIIDHNLRAHPLLASRYAVVKLAEIVKVYFCRSLRFRKRGVQSLSETSLFKVVDGKKS